MYQDIILVGLVLGVNLIATMVYLFFLSGKTGKESFFEMPVLLQKSVVLLFVGPLFVSPFLAQPHFVIWNWLRIPLSLLLIIGGLIMILAAFFNIGAVPSLREKSALITTGVYGMVRHPIYGGTILAFLGVILLTGAVIAGFYFPLSVGLYFLMTVYEERSLKAEYGLEYTEYQEKVRRRIIPFLI